MHTLAQSAGWIDKRATTKAAGHGEAVSSGGLQVKSQLHTHQHCRQLGLLQSLSDLRVWVHADPYAAAAMRALAHTRQCWT
jgi:transketolase C-terminal domain/subunit